MKSASAYQLAPPAPSLLSAVPSPSAVPRKPQVDDLLAYTVAQGASDLHLAAGQYPIVRIAGRLSPIPDSARLTPSQMQDILDTLLGADQRERFDEERELDFAYTYDEAARFRVNAFHQRGSVAVVLRLVPMNPIPLEYLGLPQVIEGFAELRDGLVLVTGPTGSGKSTTLAGLIDRINHERAENIITIEDPIEFHHQHLRSTVLQREAQSDTPSFARALRSVLREDPDVVLIGEMRDLETVSAAVTMAETGQLVFATLHTGDAASAIDRIIDVFPAHQQAQVRRQLSTSLRAVVAQRLLPSTTGGYVPVAEVLLMNPAVANIIREGKTQQLPAIMQTNRACGMVTFDAALAEAVRGGKVSYSDAEHVAVDRDEFARICGH